MFEFTLLCTVALEGHDSLDVAASYAGRGNVYELQGKYEEAPETHSKSLDIKTHILGGDSHLDVAKSYNGIGNVYYRQERALQYHQKSLEIKICVCGQDSLYVAASYTGLGNVYESQGKYEEALDMHTKSLDIKTRILGGDSHLELAKSSTSIGVDYLQARSRASVRVLSERPRHYCPAGRPPRCSHEQVQYS
jgi:tetratricopeptide (TPR) repeat protein